MSEKPGIIVPLYDWPYTNVERSIWDDWAQVAQRGIPLKIIVNPASGPGGSGYPPPEYEAVMQMLADCGVEMAIYMTSRYGQKPPQQYEKELQKIKADYPLIADIFLDEVSSSATMAGYYERLSARATSLGLSVSILNPGTAPAKEIAETAAIVCTFENTYAFWTNAAAYTPLDYEREQYAIVHSIPGETQMSGALEICIQRGVDWLYLTNWSGVQRYSRLPLFFSAFIDALAPVTPETGPPANGLSTRVAQNEADIERLRQTLRDAANLLSSALGDGD